MCKLALNDMKLGCLRKLQYIFAALVVGMTTGGMTKCITIGLRPLSAPHPKHTVTRQTMTSHRPRASVLVWSGLVRNWHSWVVSSQASLVTMNNGGVYFGHRD